MGSVWAKGFLGAVVTVSSACVGLVSQRARRSHGNGLSASPDLAWPHRELRPRVCGWRNSSGVERGEDEGRERHVQREQVCEWGQGCP